MDTFSNFRLFHEIQERWSDRISKDAKELISGGKLPFSDLFGDKLRIAEPLNEGNEYAIKISELLGGGKEYNIDFSAWKAFKLTDEEKRNPIKLNKVLNKKKQDALREIKNGVEGLNVGKYVEENPDGDMKLTTTIKPMNNMGWQRVEFDINGTVTYESVKKGSQLYDKLDKLHGSGRQDLTQSKVAELNNTIDQIDKLFKITHLQQQTNDVGKSKFHVIYSRAPIDVVRMSDFSWNSCHSSPEKPNSDDHSYFHCALADAMLNAGVVYLIDDEQYEEIKDNLQDDEVFYDDDRGTGVEGLHPQARLRIRRVIDGEGNELAVPSTKLYSSKIKFKDDFKNQVVEWAKKQDVSSIKWDSTFTLRGGTYEDAGYKIDEMVKDIWGKDVAYRKTSDDSDFHDEVQVRGNENEIEIGFWEEMWDSMEYELDDFETYTSIFGTAAESLDPSISTTRQTIELDLSFSPLIHAEYVKQQKLNDTPAGSSISQIRPSIVITDDTPNLYEFGEYWGGGDGDSSPSEFIEKAVETVESMVDTVAGKYSYEGDDDKALGILHSLNINLAGIIGMDWEEDNEDVLYNSMASESFLLSDAFEDGFTIPIDGTSATVEKDGYKTKLVINNEEDINKYSDQLIRIMDDFLKLEYGIEDAYENDIFSPQLDIPAGETTLYSPRTWKGHSLVYTKLKSHQNIETTPIKLDVIFSWDHDAVGNFINNNIINKIFKLYEDMESEDIFEKYDKHLKINTPDEFMKKLKAPAEDKNQMTFNFDEAVLYFTR